MCVCGTYTLAAVGTAARCKSSTCCVALRSHCTSLLCRRWKEAHDAGKAPPVLLSACHVRALDYVDLAVLKQYAVPEEEPQEDGQQGAQDEL